MLLDKLRDVAPPTPDMAMASEVIHRARRREAASIALGATGVFVLAVSAFVVSSLLVR